MHADMMPFVERLVVAMENISCDVKTMSQHMESISNSINDINVNLVKKRRDAAFCPQPRKETVDLVCGAPVSQLRSLLENVSSCRSGLEDWQSVPDTDVSASQGSSGNRASINLRGAGGDNLLEVDLSEESYSQSSETQKTFGGTSGLTKRVNRLTGTSNNVESSCSLDKQREHSYSKDSAKHNNEQIFGRNFIESSNNYERVLIKPHEKILDISFISATEESEKEEDEKSVSEKSVELLMQAGDEDGLCELHEEHRMTQEQNDSRKKENKESRVLSISSGQGGSQAKQQEPFLCEICGKRFLYNTNLVEHSRVHSGKRPFKCSVCKRAFTQKGALNFHMRVHSSARPFSCTLCEKAFKRKNSLQIHMRTHTGEKPYVCEVCGRAFNEQSSIIRHMRTHTLERPFKCQVCGRGFAQSSNLTNHARTHTGERPYKCPECARGFSDGRGLARHMLSHSGEAMFFCGDCGMQFSQASHICTNRVEQNEAPSVD